MLKPGLCSVGFPRLSWEEVLALAVQAGLKGIEWNTAHVPVGDLEIAARARRGAEKSGAVSCSYGTYYRAGVSEATMPFSAVLASAVALGAPMVRIWAGDRNAEELTTEARTAIVRDLLRVGGLAEAVGMQVGLEYHDNSLTNSAESAVRLMAEVPHQAVRFYWQVPTEMAGRPSLAIASLRQVASRLGYVHVFNWTGSPGHFQRHPLAEAQANWLSYLRAAAAVPAPAGVDRWALLEFTKDDDPRQMIEDAVVLADLLKAI